MATTPSTVTAQLAGHLDHHQQLQAAIDDLAASGGGTTEGITYRAGEGTYTDGDVFLFGGDAYAANGIATAAVFGGATNRENVIGGNTANVDTPTSNLTGAPALTGEDGNWNFLLSGYDNVVNGWACVINGYHVKVEAGANHGTIGGGSLHSFAVDVGYPTIGGGTNNDVNATEGTIAGGSGNVIATGATQGSISGGAGNTVSGARGSVMGGTGNTAAGTNSTVAGGTTNNAGGAGASIGGGITNTAAGNNASVGGGTLNDATGSSSVVAGGSDCNATQSGTTVGGGANNTASGFYSTIPGGLLNTASGNYDTALGREAASARYGGQVQAAGKITTAGDAQTSVLVARRQTTDATPAVLGLDGTVNLPIVIATHSSVHFSVMLVGRRVSSGGEASAAYKFEGLIKNDGGTVSFVGTPTTTLIAEDDATWDAAVSANNTNKSLTITVTGAAAMTVNWVARVTLVEVVG